MINLPSDSKPFFYAPFQSQLCQLAVISGKNGIVQLLFVTKENKESLFTTIESLLSCGTIQESPKKLNHALTELKAYFDGLLTEFSTPVDLWGTPFQKSVWDELRRIPFGSTTSYGEIATRIGNPKAQRAVGMANNRNPVPIIIPCHRVIGKNGDLTGFAPGVSLKKKLLQLEER